MKGEVYLITKNADLIRHFENSGGKTKVVAFPSFPVTVPLGSFPRLTIIDSDGNWEQEIKTVATGRREKGESFYSIISSASSLQGTSTQIDDIALQLDALSSPSSNKNTSEATQKGEKEHGLHIVQFIEKSVFEFVRKVKHSRPKNLYDLIISEFEKPIFHAALQEMDGNQVRAAELLGMHRNTLRKKIKALKIPIKKQQGEKQLSRLSESARSSGRVK